MSRNILFAFLILLTGGCYAQQYRKGEDDNPKARPQKIGVRIGIGTSWLKAPEMLKGTPQTGVEGAVYYRYNLSKHFHLQAEFGAAYRGENYPHDPDDPGNYYTKLGLFYLEMPLLAMISIDEKQKHNLLIGPTVSYLVKPSLFIRNGYYPAFTILPIKKWEFAATAGYLFSTEYVGIYAGLKFGLNNIAGDFARFNIHRDSGNETPTYFDEIDPTLENVKSMFNRSIEISLYF